MTWADWLGLAVAIGICVALPFLHAAERRAARRDEARREEAMRQARVYCEGLLRDMRRGP